MVTGSEFITLVGMLLLITKSFHGPALCHRKEQNEKNGPCKELNQGYK